MAGLNLAKMSAPALADMVTRDTLPYAQNIGMGAWFRLEAHVDHQTATATLRLGQLRHATAVHAHHSPVHFLHVAKELMLRAHREWSTIGEDRDW